MHTLQDIEQLECEANHSRPSTVVTENSWSFIFTFPVCLHGVAVKIRENFNNKYITFKIWGPDDLADEVVDLRTNLQVKD
jgi:hypothetical protein